MGYFSRFKVRNFTPEDKVFLADGITCSVIEEERDLIVIETRYQPRIEEAVLDFEYVFRWLLEHGGEVVLGELVKI